MQNEPPRINARVLFARARDAKLPAWPQSIRAVLALCGDRYVSAEKIAEVILEDYGLSFRLFRLMNSAFFSVQRKDLVSIRYMVVLLGLENLTRAVSRTKVLRVPRRPDPAWDAWLFFMAQGVLAGKLAGMMADHLKYDQEKAAIMAMFRNLGMVISSLLVPEITVSCLDTARSVVSEDKFKKACGGYTTETLGLELARSWNLPELVRLAICPSRFNLNYRAVEDQDLFFLVESVRNMLLACLSGTGGRRRMQGTRDALQERFDLEQKPLRQILFQLRRDFSRSHAVYYRMFESLGLFGRLLDG